MIQAIVFDVDGTLLNSEVIFMRAWKEAGLAFGYDIPQQALRETRAVNATVGAQIFRRYCGADFPYMDIRARRIAISEALFQQTAPESLRMPHVQQVLEWLRQRKVPMAVASSTNYETTCSHLRRTDLLDYFDAVVGGDMVQLGKPAPDIFLKAAQLLGTAPQDCMVVGDTPADVLASSAAGIPVILIPDQVPANEQTIALSYQVLGGLAELPAVLEKLL